MNAKPPPTWLVIGSVLGCLFVIEYFKAIDAQTDFVTYYYPGQAELVKALTEDHALVPVTTFIVFETMKRLDP